MDIKRVAIKSNKILAHLKRGIQVDQETIAIVNELVKKGKEPESLNDPTIEDVKYFLGLGKDAVLGQIICDDSNNNPFERVVTCFHNDLIDAKALTLSYCYSDRRKDALYWMYTVTEVLEQYLDVMDAGILFGFKYIPQLKKDEIALLIIK